MKKPINYYLATAKALMKAREPQRALAALRPGLAQHGREPRILFWAGRAAMRCNEYEEGEVFLLKALRQNPENRHQILENLMIIYEHQERWGDALVILERNLLKYPKSDYIEEKIQAYRSHIEPDLLACTYSSFVFTHIQKTGGSSLRQYIFDGALRGGIAPQFIHAPGMYGQSHKDNLIMLESEQLKKIKEKKPIIVADHSHYDPVEIFKMTSLKAPFYYVMMREPTERFKSHYYYDYFVNKASKLHNVGINELNQRDFEEVLMDLSNLQTMYLTGYQWWRKGYEMDEATFKKACENLEYRYHCLGIFEYMDASISVLKKTAPVWLKLADTLPVKNRSTMAKYETVLNERVVESIKKFNKWDYKLYDFALNLFKKHCL